MASRRLTVSERAAVVNRLLIHTFQARARQYVLDRCQLGEDVYQDFFTPDEHVLIESLPKGWLHEDPEIMVRFGPSSDDVVEAHWCASGIYGVVSRVAEISKMPDNLKPVLNRLHRVPKCMREGVVKVYDADHPLTVRYFALKEERKTLEGQITAAESRAKKMLELYPRTGTLLSVWPEIEPFLPKERVAVQLPAIPRADLNAMFDLPVE